MTRRDIRVTLSAEQRDRLERLWFIYGNYGEKTTPGNHQFIQRLLENGSDERPLKLKGSTPTPECAAVVDRILGAEHGLRIAEVMTKRGATKKTGLQ